MILKNGVNPFGIKQELMLALIVADRVWPKFGQELVVTSINDGEHSYQSLHYAGFAADLRIRYFPERVRSKVAAALRLALGNSPDYDVILESTHIHIEYQPKLRGSRKV